MTGDYLWEQANSVPAGEFRPLYDPNARLKLMACPAFWLCPANRYLVYKP